MGHLIRKPGKIPQAVALSVIAVAILAVAAVIVRSNAAENTVVSETIEGEFIHSVEDDLPGGKTREAYAVKTSAAQHRDILTNGRKLNIRTGSRVRIKGHRRSLSPKELQVNPDEQNSVEILAPAATTTESPGTIQLNEPSSGPGLLTKNIKQAVLIVDMRIVNTSTSMKIGAPLLSANTATSRYFTHPKSVKNYYGNTTQQRIAVSGEVVGTFTINISGTDATTCAYNTWADMADKAAAAAGVSLAGYTHKAYLLPIIDTTVCDFGGVGNVGGPRAWYKYAVEGYQPPAAANVEDYFQSGYAHELGHNLGMRHSNSLHCVDGESHRTAIGGNCSITTYGDPFDLMGGTADYRELDATHRLNQGQLAVAEVKTATTSGTYTLSPSNAAGTSLHPKLIRMKFGTGTLDLEYRKNNGGLFDTFSAAHAAINGVTIRRVRDITTSNGDSQLIDMTPGTASRHDAPLVSGSFYDPVTKTSIRVLSRTADAITIAIQVEGTAAEPPAPTITSVSPTSGPAGTTVKVSGTGFSATGVHLRFGGNPVTSHTVMSDAAITFAMPAVAPGSYNIDVLTPWGTKRSLAGAFTVTAAPTSTATPTATPSAAAADVNGDAKVDVFDLSLVLGAWGSSNVSADLNKDGTVNVFDLSRLLVNWKP